QRLARALVDLAVDRATEVVVTDALGHGLARQVQVARDGLVYAALRVELLEQLHEDVRPRRVLAGLLAAALHDRLDVDPVLDGSRQPLLVVRRQQRDLADLPQVHADRVVDAGDLVHDALGCLDHLVGLAAHGVHADGDAVLRQLGDDRGQLLRVQFRLRDGLDDVVSAHVAGAPALGEQRVQAGICQRGVFECLGHTSPLSSGSWDGSPSGEGTPSPRRASFRASACSRATASRRWAWRRVRTSRAMAVTMSGTWRGSYSTSEAARSAW